MPDRCACGCGRTAALPYASLMAGAWWRNECLDGIVADVLRLREGSACVVGARVAFLSDNGAACLARAVVGPLPFGDGDGQG